MASVDYLLSLSKSTRVEICMQDKLTNLITPVTKDGTPDHRFNASMVRILEELGEGTIDELRQFFRETAQTQRRAASAGLRLAIAVFHEASYLDKNHRFDEDNKFGWRSKALRKQAQQILEQIGFKQKNAHKLVSAASWLTSHYFSKDEQKWLESLTPSHIYELSRMSDEGYLRVKKQVAYPGYTFSAGQQEISVRALELLRGQYPQKQLAQVEDSATSQLEGSDKGEVLQSVRGVKDLNDCSQLRSMTVENLQAATDAIDFSNTELVEQFIALAQSINWGAVSTDNSSCKRLSSIQDTLNFLAGLANESFCSALV